MADKNIYTRLRRLFSSNVIVRNVGGRKLKVTDTSRIQTNRKQVLLIDIQNYTHHMLVQVDIIIHYIRRLKDLGCSEIMRLWM